MSSPAVGAPGIYLHPDVPLRRLTGVRMDVCAFVGVAPRGAARVPPTPVWYGERGRVARLRRTIPVPVESWGEYLREFGGFEGPGLLPYAVAAFFEQGGRRAYVARIVHEYGDERDEAAVARGAIPGLLPAGPRGLPLRARSRGLEMNGAFLKLTWRTRALTLAGATPDRVEPTVAGAVRAGSLLRLELRGGGLRFAFVSEMAPAITPGAADTALLRDRVDGVPQSALVVTAEVEVRARDGRVERFTDLDLTPPTPRPEGPRWIADVLAAESELLAPDPRWLGSDLLPDGLALGAPPLSPPLGGGTAATAAAGVLYGVRPANDGLWLRARSEGSWGNRLRARMTYQAAALLFRSATPGTLTVDADLALPVGSLLRLTLPGGGRELRFARDVLDELDPGSGTRVRRVVLESLLPAAPLEAEVVLASLEVREETAAARWPTEPARTELHDRLGLSPAHPRWLGRVLHDESRLVHPDPEWLATSLVPTDVSLPSGAPPEGQFEGGLDRYVDIVPEDFFGRWTPGDEEPADGVHSLVELPDPALLVVPDLYSPGPLPDEEPITDPPSFAGPTFRECVAARPRPQAARVEELAGLRLDPKNPAQRARIVALQRRLVELAETLRTLVVLLDVPPGLSDRQIADWRARFGSDFAAAYHPWLLVARSDDRRDSRLAVNPSAFAAGVIARHEELFGVQRGPANVAVRGAVDLADRVTAARHDGLHPLGVNVFVPESPGIRLLGARTLSRRPEYRQLSVRRLVTMLLRTLEVEMQWAVFEPNGPRLREEIRHTLTSLLRELFLANAFAGGTEEESFFVRCDEENNPEPWTGAGRLLAEVGVAPAEPIEFIVLRIARGGEGALIVEE